jgi:hypothetical protein
MKSRFAELSELVKDLKSAYLNEKKAKKHYVGKKYSEKGEDEL